MEWLCTVCLPYLASSCILVFTNQIGLVSVEEVIPREQKRNTAVSTRITLAVCEELLIYQVSDFCLENWGSLQFESDLELLWEWRHLG